MNTHTFNAIVDDLLLKLTTFRQNKQKEIFQKYVDILPKFILQKVKKLLMEYHPFLSFELIEFLNKSNQSNNVLKLLQNKFEIVLVHYLQI